MNTIKILLSCVTNIDCDLLQFDMKNAFLHEDLEEVYIRNPPRLDDDKTQGKVCKLKKAL